MSQTKSCAVDTNHDQHCLSIPHLTDFCTNYEVISWCRYTPGKPREKTEKTCNHRTHRPLRNRAI
jgi:hypothetical protein